jgi:PHS family inorganic phosphate transporter-like MFS transporter
VWISALSNISIQYNLSVIAVCLLIMDPSTNDDVTVDALYPRADIYDQWLRSSVFAGAIVGQAVMGGLGDILGRGKAMILTNAFTFLGALLCAVASWGSSEDVYGALIGYRFLMGVGIGGKYPLASTIRAEATSSSEHRATEVAKGFFWQTPGVIAPYLLGWILVAAFGSEKNGTEVR